MARKQKRRELDKQEAVKWAQRHTLATNHQQKLFDKFRDFFDVLYAVRSTKNVAPWRSKLYVPILAGKAWDFIAKLADIEPYFQAAIRDEWTVDEQNQPIYPPEVLDRAERISRKLSYDWKNPLERQSPRDKVFSTLVDTVATGTGLAKVSRCVTKKEYKAHEALGPSGMVDTENEIQMTVEEGHNTFEPVNIFNVRIAPFTQDLQAAPWIIIDGFSSLDELYQEGVYDEAQLAKIDADFRTDGDQMAQYNVARNRLMTSDDNVAVDDTVNLLKTHECYERNDEGEVVIQTYVENAGEDGGWLKIRELVDPYWHNLYPLQSFYIRRKPYSFWGESLFENNETLQYASNDLFNHYMDNLNLSLDGMVMMEENALVEDFVVAPGEMLIYRGEQPKQFKFNEPDPNQLSIVMQQIDKAVEAATVSQYASGNPNSAIDKTHGTATGVTRIMEAAEDKLGFMRSNFKSSMEGVGFMWLLNDQQFMDRPQEIPQQDANGKTAPMVVTPLDLQGVITITLDDDSLTPVSKEAKRQVMTQYIAQVQALAQSSLQQAMMMGTPEDILRLNYAALARDASMTYGQRFFSSYFLPATGAPLPAINKPKEIIDYKDAPEDVKRQMEQAAGFQPSNGTSPIQQKNDLVAQKQSVDAARLAHDATLGTMKLAHDATIGTMQLEHQKEMAAQTAKIAAKQPKQPVKGGQHAGK